MPDHSNSSDFGKEDFSLVHRLMVSWHHPTKRPSGPPSPFFSLPKIDFEAAQSYLWNAWWKKEEMRMVFWGFEGASSLLGGRAHFSYSAWDLLRRNWVDRTWVWMFLNGYLRLEFLLIWGVDPGSSLCHFFFLPCSLLALPLSPFTLSPLPSCVTHQHKNHRWRLLGSWNLNRHPYTNVYP